MALILAGCGTADTGEEPIRDPAPLHWERVDAPALTGVVLVSVVAVDRGVVAVGWDRAGDGDHGVWRSVDGVAWERADAAAFDGARLAAVVTGGPGLVAVGSVETGEDEGFSVRRAAVWTSSDGVGWERVTHDEAVFGREAEPDTGIVRIEAITSGPAGLVAAGIDLTPDHGGDDWAVITWTSPDGTTWTRSPDDPGLHMARFRAVSAGGPGYIAGGSVSVNGWRVAAVWTSSDGVGWERVTHDEAVFGRHSTEIHGIVAAGSGFVAVGVERRLNEPPRAAAWASDDGRTWSRVEHDDATLGGPGDRRMLAAAATGFGLVAVGVAGGHPGVWVSADGARWQAVAVDGDDGWLEAVVGGGPGVVAVGSGGVWVGTPDAG